MPNKSNGYSILETLVTTSILSVSLASAVPSMMDLIHRNKVDVTKNQLFSALYFARSTAITEQIDTHVCALDYDANKKFKCGTYSTFNSSWSKGWLVFIDRNKNYNYDGEQELIKVYENESDVKVVMNQRGRLRFRANGMARSTGFYVCDTQDKHHFHVYLLHTGRARISDALGEKQRLKCRGG